MLTTQRSPGFHTVKWKEHVHKVFNTTYDGLGAKLKGASRNVGQGFMILI